MELLELLEERIEALVAEVQKLRKENNTLREELSTYADFLDQHKRQANELNQSRANTENVRMKIQAMLDKVQNAMIE